MVRGARAGWPPARQPLRLLCARLCAQKNSGILLPLFRSLDGTWQEGSGNTRRMLPS